jgi:hypothetical protein
MKALLVLLLIVARITNMSGQDVGTIVSRLSVTRALGKLENG